MRIKPSSVYSLIVAIGIFAMILIVVLPNSIGIIIAGVYLIGAPPLIIYLLEKP